MISSVRVGGSQEVSEYRYAAHERPTLPGGPFVPDLSRGRRTAYGIVGALLGVACTFPNALVNTNVANLAGPMGLYVAQASWLPAIYVAMNATANLTLVKARTQFGIPTVTQGLLFAYLAIGIVQLLQPGFAAAAAARAVNGVTAAALLTVSVYYLLQAFPPKYRPFSLVLGIGLPQLGTPLARLMPVDALAANQWLGLRLLEPSLAMLLLALMKSLPLPPSERSRVFEKIDLLTITLCIPAMLLLCGVLGLGRIYWWTDFSILGKMLVAAVVLFVLTIAIEAGRKNPLLRTDWLSRADIIRFAAVAIVVRLALAEQTYGSVGLLTFGGLDNDQLHTLFALVSVAMLAGIGVACLTLSPTRLRHVVAVAALIIAAGAWIDSGSTSMTRPAELYLSQMLIGFGTTLFIGPTMVYGFLQMMARGANHLATFIVLFSITQNVGGLAGSALLGSYQIAQERVHATSLAGSMTAADPNVAQRLTTGSQAFSGTIPNSATRAVLGTSQLNQRLLNEANVLAYNDVFRLVAWMAMAAAAYLLYRIALTAWSTRAARKQGASG